MPTLGAFAYRHITGKPYVYPNNELSYSANFLSMLFTTGVPKYEPDPRIVKALDVLFILHADHEQNCSTSAVRSVGSSQVDPYSAVAAGVSALYGPLHGGANEAVLQMLRRIEKVENIPAFIEGVKGGKERLMGFGHRVYKNFDPRATIIKKACDDVFEVTGVNPLLAIAVELEKIALQDEYFVKRKLYPNVDFYSGLIYEALGHARRDVHGALRHRAHAGLGRPVERDASTTRSRRSRARARSTSAPTSATTWRSAPARRRVRAATRPRRGAGGLRSSEGARPAARSATGSSSSTSCASSSSSSASQMRRIRSCRPGSASPAISSALRA